MICSIIEDVTTLFQLCLSNITNLVKQHFDENNVDEKCQDLIMDVLSTDGAYGNPFCGLETEYQQQKYFKEKFSMNVSIRCSYLELASFNKVMAQIVMGELVDS